MPRPPSGRDQATVSRIEVNLATFTPRQGQFLAFIHLYRRLHRRGPAELDMVKFFRVTPPAVHAMVVKLEELGLVTREPGVARSIRVALRLVEGSQQEADATPARLQPTRLLQQLASRLDLQRESGVCRRAVVRIVDD